MNEIATKADVGFFGSAILANIASMNGQLWVSGIWLILAIFCALAIVLEK